MWVQIWVCHLLSYPTYIFAPISHLTIGIKTTYMWDASVRIKWNCIFFSPEHSQSCGEDGIIKLSQQGSSGDTDAENRLADTEGRLGWANWGGSIEHVHCHVRKWTAGGNVLCGAESSNPVLCDNPEGWDRVGGGREVKEGGDIQYLRLIRVGVWQKSTQHCKATTLQLKKKYI